MAKTLFWTILILVIFGLIMLSSAGIVDAQKKFNSPYFYFYHQLFYSVLPGLVLMFAFAKIDYRWWKKLAMPILFAGLVLVALVFIPSLGQGLKGATRWIHIFGYSFQPSECLKLAMIVYLATWFSSRDERLKNWSYGMAPFFIVLAFVGVLLILQPDLGTLIVVTLISVGLYFAAGGSLKHIGIAGAIILVLMAAMIYFEPYRLDRIRTFFDPSIDPRGISYQVNQSLISIGSGGLFGNGFGNSSQKLGFLPEVVSDSIFSVVVEELGLVGGGLVILVFAWLCFIFVKIAKNTRDKFGSLFVMGMGIWICSQAFLNIASNAGIAPLTGIPLPFISYGGTAMIVLLSGIGISINIAND